MIEGDKIPMGGAMGYGGRNLTPEMRFAAERFIAAGPGHLLLAQRMEALWRKTKGNDGARFSLKDVVQGHDMDPAWLEELRQLGILTVVTYPSGAWQYEFTHYTRSWFFLVQALGAATK